MSLKKSFSAEEWNTLMKAPMMVSYAVAGAAPSGGIGFVKEMKAVADAIFDAGEQYPEGVIGRSRHEPDKGERHRPIRRGQRDVLGGRDQREGV